MTTVRELFVKLGVKADTAALTRFDSALTNVKGGMVEAARFAAGMATAVVGVTGALFANTLATVDEAAKYEKLAKMMGVTVDTAQELSDGLERLGVDSRDTADLFGNVAQYIDTAKQGGESAVTAFKTLGLTAKDLTDIPLDEALNRIADGLVSVKDPTTRLATAGVLLGEDLTKKLYPALLNGRAGLNDMRASVRALGGQIGADGVAKAKAFRTAWQSITGQFQAVRREIGIALLPVFTSLLERVQAFITINRGAITSAIAVAVEQIDRAVALLGETIERVDEVVREDLGGWERLLVAVAAAATTLGAVFTAGKIAAAIPTIIALAQGIAAIAGALSAPAWGAVGAVIAIVIAIVIAFGLAVEDFIVYMLGGKSALGDFLEYAKDGGGALGKMAVLFENLVDTTVTLGGALLRVGMIIGEVLTPMGMFFIDFLISGFREWADLIGVVVMPLLDNMVAVLQIANQLLGSSGLRGFARGGASDFGQSSIQGSRENFGAASLAAQTRPTLGSMIAGDPGNNRSALGTVSNAVSIVVQGDVPDPDKLVRKVEEVLASAYRQAAETFAGGDR